MQWSSGEHVGQEEGWNQDLALAWEALIQAAQICDFGSTNLVPFGLLPHYPKEVVSISFALDCAAASLSPMLDMG